jgi:hypothetical protein
VNGVLLFGALCTAGLYWLLHKGAQRSRRLHELLLALLPLTTVACVASMDFDHMRTYGITMATTPIVIIILAILRGRA